MKKLVVLLMCVAVATGMGFSQNKNSKKAKLQETVEFRLGEEICSNCKRKIDNNIAFEKGVSKITYGENGNSVQVTYQTAKTDTLKLRKAFDKVKLNVVNSEIVAEKSKK